MSNLLKLARINQHDKFLSLTYVIFLKRKIVRYSSIDQAIIHMALNTPIIFHEPYGFPMLGCFYGFYGFYDFFFYLHYLCAEILQFSAQIEASLLGRHWTHSVTVFHTLALQPADEKTVCWVNNLIPSIVFLREKMYEAFSRRNCPHQRQVQLFHLYCCPLFLSPIWRTAFKSSRDSLAQYLSCLFFFLETSA